MDDEPIRFLTHEAFEAHRASIIASRAREEAKQSAPQSEATGPQNAPLSSSPEQEVAKLEDRPNKATKDLPSPQALELGSQIWELRKKGFSAYEVHRRLAIPLSSVEKILQEFEEQLYPDAGAAMAQRLVIDDGRLEDLFRTWLPIAAGGPVAVTKTDKKGREYVEMDVDTPVRAAGIVLTAIQRRIQLTMAIRPEGAVVKDGSGATNIAIWLSQVMPGVSKIVNQVGGRQNLVLECAAEAEINGSPTNGQQPSGGSNR
jgi:hypothetical protein